MTRTSIAQLDQPQAEKVTSLLQGRLVALLDLQLTLKHIHWNVTGPNFIAVHEMLDPQTDKVRDMSDVVAERIATLGVAPIGTPGHIANSRTWQDYGIERAAAETHLEQLDAVLSGVVKDHRAAMEDIEEIDAVTHDALVAQVADLELFQWFVRSHLETAS